MLARLAITNVSVPLRGLGSWKETGTLAANSRLSSFSPLAGIRFVESSLLDTLTEEALSHLFQSPCGD